MKLSQFATRFARLALVCVFITSCSENDMVGTSLASLSSAGSLGQCKVQNAVATQATHFIQPFAKKKVSLDLTSTAQQFGMIQQKGAPSRMPAGTAVTAVVDRHCAQETFQNGGDLPFTSRLNPNEIIKSDTTSAEQSFKIILPSDMSPEELEAKADQDPCIVGIGSHGYVHTFALSNDALIAEQTHHPFLHSAEGWDIFYDPVKGIKKDIIIAVVDTGADLNHADLAPNLWVNTKEIPGNGIDDDKNGFVDDINGWNFASNTNNPMDGNGHGTHVSGLAAARSNNNIGVAGIMGMHAKIMVIKAIPDQGGGDFPALDNGIRYAADNGADIINMSLGANLQSDSTAQALDYAVKKGVTIIAAAGNSSADIDQTFFTPASYARTNGGVISVASVDSANGNKSYFSNYGVQTVEIASPGATDSSGGYDSSIGIFSTWTGGQYLSRSPAGVIMGTSMASPIVAGAAGLAYALIYSRTFTKPTPSMIKTVMLAAAIKKPDLATQIKNGAQLDLLALAQYIDKNYPQQAPPPPPPSAPPTSGESNPCP